MAAMRHSRIELAMNLYTGPVLRDVPGAVNVLPGFGGHQSSGHNALPPTDADRHQRGRFGHGPAAGRYVDFHSLRVSLSTMLAAHKVSLP